MQQASSPVSNSLRPSPDSSWMPFVICADDYALTPEISDGIVVLAQKNCISATSVMSLSPHWATWAPPLRDLRNVVDVGLHLDLTSTYAVNQGFGESLPTLMLKSAFRFMRPANIEQAIEEQLDFFEDHFRAPPDHVDGHQHIHQFPVIRNSLIKVLSRRYSGKNRPWIRISRVASQAVNIKGKVINAMGANALQSIADEHGFAHSKQLSGVYDFQGGEVQYAQQLRNWLQKMSVGTVLMCHPSQGYAGQAPLPEARQWEQEVLMGEKFQEMLVEARKTVARGSIFTH